MANRFVLNETRYHGKGAIKEIVNEIKARGFGKVLVCVDPDLIKFGVAAKVTDLLDQAKIPYEIFSQVKANPTVANVQAGVAAFKASKADAMLFRLKGLLLPRIRAFLSLQCLQRQVRLRKLPSTTSLPTRRKIAKWCA